MGTVLVQGAVIGCPHGGQLRLLTGDAHLVVAGEAVLTSGMEAPLTFGSPVAPVPGMISPCQAVTPAGAPVPCVTSASLPPGLATTLTVRGRPVLLDSASGPTVSGAGPGLWSVTDPGQRKLEAG